MKTFTSRLISVMLIGSVIILQMPSAFADEAASSTEAIATPVVVEQPVTPTPDTTASTTISDSTNTPNPLVPVQNPVTDPVPHELLTQLASTTDASTTPSEIEDTATTSIIATNSGTTTNSATTTASTGDNSITTAGTSTGTSTIITGDANADSTVTNIVNANVINSDALVTVLTNASGGGSVNLRDIGGNTCDECSVSTTSLADNSTLTASSTNDAVIDNVVVVRSNTGNNTSSSTDALILTGDAYATANVVNVANTNIIDSHYLLLVLNNLGNLDGDIVLPTADFFNQFLQSTNSNSTNPYTVKTTNNADIGTTIMTAADTGNNSASTTDDAVIATGDAHSGSTVFNDVNQNHIGGNAVGIIFRIFGDWSGQTFNMPDGFSAQSTPNGIQFVRVGSTSPVSNLTSTVFSTSTNNATISNDVSVSAVTGENSVEGDNGLIATGDAYATANIVNIANTNIIGTNWLNAIINIYGDWHGNVSFGQPDLWVGTRADVKPADNNSSANAEITYYYTIKNNGDAPAHNVMMNHDIGSSLITSDNSVFDIGTLAPGEIRDIVQVAHVASDVPHGDTPVTSTITVNATESDSNIKDNTDMISVVLKGAPLYVNPTNYDPLYSGIPAHFSVTKLNNASSALTASSSVDYTINIKNEGGYARHAMLHDEIKSPTGEIIHAEDWDLDAVDSQEEITVTYTAFFNASTTPGMYTNTAQVYSYDNLFPDSPIATSTIVITQPAPLAKVTPQKNKIITLSIAQASTDEPEIIATATPVVVAALTSTPDIKKSQLANVFSALGHIPAWFWLILLIIIIGVLLSRRTKNTI